MDIEFNRMPSGFPGSVLYVSGTETGREELAHRLGVPVTQVGGQEAAESYFDGDSPLPEAVVVRPPLAEGTPRAVCADARARDPDIHCFVVDASVPNNRVPTVDFASGGWSGVAATVRRSVVDQRQSPYPVPDGEDRRCSAASGVLADAKECERADAAAHAALEAADASGAIVGLITHRRKYVVGRAGAGKRLPSPLRRANTICTHTIADPGPLVVTDGRADPRFADLVPLAEFGIESYAGVPIEVRGERVGTLCVYDDTRRSFGRETEERLTDLAADLGSHLEAVWGG